LLQPFKQARARARNVLVAPLKIAGVVRIGDCFAAWRVAKFEQKFYFFVKFSLSEAIDIPNDAKLNLGDSAALNLLSAIIFAWETMKDMQAFSGSVLVCEFYKKFSG